MQWTAFLSLLFSLVAVTGSKLSSPPVILDLGPISPTPLPTPVEATKKRLITTITVQNGPEGESLIKFEASDFGIEDKAKPRFIASKSYSVSEAEEKPALQPLSDSLIRKVRELEREMLEFVEQSGPPKPRQPVVPGARPN